MIDPVQETEAVSPSCELTVHTRSSSLVSTALKDSSVVRASGSYAAHERLLTWAESFSTNACQKAATAVSGPETAQAVRNSIPIKNVMVKRIVVFFINRSGKRNDG